MIASGAHGLELLRIGTWGLPLEPSNYDDSTAASFERVVAELKSDTPTGRLVILNGPPRNRQKLPHARLCRRRSRSYIYLDPIFDGRRIGRSHAIVYY